LLNEAFVGAPSTRSYSVVTFDSSVTGNNPLVYFLKSQSIFSIPHARNQPWIQFILSFPGTVMTSVAGDGKDLAASDSGLQAHAGLLWIISP
jgi:hypothetical protein